MPQPWNCASDSAGVRKRTPYEGPRPTAWIWHTRTDACNTPACLSRCHALLDASERRRLDGFALEAPRREYLLAHALCRLALSEFVPVAPDAWRFDRNAYGRPEVAHPAAGMALNFNISHTAGRVACVISGAGQIGLDVERIRSNMDVEELARGHFSQAENAAIAARAPAERRKAFYELWVLKEAYVKACGKGLSIPLDAFSIIRDGADIAVRPEPDSSYSRQQWRFWLGMFEDDLPVAVAASDQGAFDLMPVLRDATPLLLGLPAGPSPDGGWPQSTGSPIGVSRSS